MSRLDGIIMKNAINTHDLNEGETLPEFTGCTETTSGDTELLVPAPYDDLLSGITDRLLQRRDRQINDDGTFTFTDASGKTYKSSEIKFNSNSEAALYQNLELMGLGSADAVNYVANAFKGCKLMQSFANFAVAI